MSYVVHGRGRLTEADHASIHELAAAGLKSGAIARSIKRHPSTVKWFMHVEGLSAPKPADGRLQMQYRRGDQVVYRYSAEEDAFILALRVQGYGLTEIARLASRRFSHPRTFHGIRVRLVMLAARDDEPVEA